jgi:hypothetical protein
MAAPTRVARSTEATAQSTTIEARADVAAPRPALMDRLHFERADAAHVQRTLGNQLAQRLAREKRLTGDAPVDGSAPKRDLDADKNGAPRSAHADDVDVLPVVAPDATSLPTVSVRTAAAPSPAAPVPRSGLGVPIVKPPAPTSATTVGDLQGQVARAADSIPTPSTGGFTAAQQAIRAQGFRLARASGASAPTRTSARGGRPHLEHPDRPFEPDPVPKESKALLDAGEKKLAELPALSFEPTPLKHVPQLGSHPLSGSDFAILLAAPTGSRKQLLDAEDKRRLDDRKAKREAAAAAEKDPKKKAELLAAKPGAEEPKTFAEMRELLSAAPNPDSLKEQAKKKHNDKDVEDAVPNYKDPDPPGPITFPEAKKDQLGKVLAALMAEPDATAQAILHEIRPTVVSKVRLGDALEAVFPTIGESQKGKITEAFKTKVADLQKGAGIADADLAKRIEERKAELVQIRADARASASQAQIDAKRELREQAKADAAATDAKKDAAQAKTTAIKKAAPKAKLPMDTEARHARLLGYVTKDVADIVVKYKQKGEMRDMTVARMVRDYIDAYRFAEQQDEYAITTTAKDPKSAATGTALEASRSWLTRVSKGLEQKKVDQKKADAANVALLQGGVRTAGDLKREAIRSWAERVSGKKRSEEQKGADKITDMADQVKAEATAIGTLEKQRIALGVSGDFGVVDKIAEEVKQGHDREAIIANLRLNTVQTAILDAYLKPPEPGDDRALSGVMAGVRTRIQMELQPEIAPAIEREILEKHSDNDPVGANAVGLNQIGGVQTSGFNAYERAQKAHAALDKIDTDEDAVYAALDSLTKIQAQAIRLAYMRIYKGSTIEGDLEGGVIYGMSGSELKRAQLLLAANQPAADAMAYRLALKGNEGAWYHLDVGSGDSEALDKINHGKSLEERQAAEDAYNAENDPVLKAQLANETDDSKRRAILDKYRADGKSQLREDANASLATDRQKEKFSYSMAGDDDSADALELRGYLPTPADVRMAESAPRDGSVDPAQFVVADRQKVEAIYDRIRREATARADQEHWITAQLEAEIARRTQKIEAIFDAKFGKDYETDGKGALRTAFDVGFRQNSDEKNIANALADNDVAKADAAKIHVEHRGVYADDDVENAVLQAQYQRALADERRDELPLRRVIMAREMVDLEKKTRADARAAAMLRGASDEQADLEAKNAWNGKKQWAARERMQRDIDRTLERAAADQAKGNMNALRDAYQRDYGDNLDEVVKSDTSGYSGDKAQALLAQNGQLTLGQTMFYAIRGAGTDEDALNTLKGHTKAEIGQARVEFKELAEKDLKTPRGILNQMWSDPDVDPTNMDTEILDDVSGRTGFDVSQMLKGEPETIDEKRQRLLEAIDWENKAGPLGQLLASDQQDVLREDLRALDQTIRKLEDPNLTAEQRDVYLGFFDQGVETVNAGITAHREMLDTWTDRITTVVGLVVGLAVTILTFGAAGPVLAAVLGSVLATAATMSLKAGIKGAAYGWEDITTDIAVGIVDALAAALTAGMGEKLLGAAKSAVEPTASKLAIGWTVQKSLAAGGRFAALNPAESMLARAIPTSAVLKEMVERGGIAKLLALVLAEGGETIAASTPSALAASILDENNYKEGNPVGNILTGTAKQVGTGAAMGLAMKAGMRAGKPLREFAGRMFEAVRTPEAPALHHFELARKEFPGITYEEFSKLRAAAVLESRLRDNAVSEHPGHGEEPQAHGAGEGGGEPTSGAPSRDRLALPDEHVPAEEVGATRPSDAGAPAPHDPNVIKADDVTTPREMTEAHSRELVPKSLRDKITVSVDPHEAPGAVKVERVMRLGVVVDVKLIVGPHVRPIDIVMHAPTIHAMQRYVGVVGAVARVIERMRSFIVRDGMPPFGTKAWESWHELNKLPRILEQRIEMLRTGALDPHAEAMIHADIERLARQIDEHRATLERRDKSPGAGYIAMEGVKKPPAEPYKDRKIDRTQASDSRHERYVAEHSALQKKYPDAQFLSVDRPWLEAKPEGTRTYRILEVRDPKTDEVLVRREEIQSIDSNNNPLEHWVQRGSESNIIGAIAEEASSIQVETERAGKRKGEIPLPADVLKLGGGQGFDGVIVKFDEHGKATVVLIEVKNYPGRYIPLADITAIKENLNANLERLIESLKDKAHAQKLGLTKQQAAAAINAIRSNSLKFELHVSHDTKIGAISDTRASVLRDLHAAVSATRKFGFPIDSVSVETIRAEHMSTAKALFEARERLGDSEQIRELAKGTEGHLTTEGVRHAEAALVAQQMLPGIDKKPLGIGTKSGSFADAKGSPVTVIAPKRSAKIPKLAEDLAKTLRASRSTPGKPTRIVIDVTELGMGQRQVLRRQLRQLASKRPAVDLKRVYLVDVQRRFAAPFGTGSR